jgi:hypothetical protein
MTAPNWWLFAVAFVLGAALTWALMVHRVRREVPVHEPRISAGAAILDAAQPKTPPTTPRRVDVTGDSHEAEESDVVEPYGPGSVRLAIGTADAPVGYPVKIDEAATTLHAPGSAGYDDLVADVFFSDVAAAERAGFSG